MGIADALAYDKAFFCNDYTLHEGTWGHTQDDLAHLHRTASAATSERVRLGAFTELFPHFDPPSSP